MPSRISVLATVSMAVLSITPLALAGGMTPEVKTKVEYKAKQLQAWGTDPQIVAAVREYNANPPAEGKTMTNEKWKTLTLLDPFVRALTKNPLATYLKAKAGDEISEIFVSGADGVKVAFLSKTTTWNHKGKDKHDVPMTGKVWIGPVEVDESTGVQQVQVGIPVLEDGKPIGSIVAGLSIARLK